MQGPVVQLDGVWKRFTLHHERHRTFQELALSGFRPRGTTEEFWALRDVSLAVQPGRSVGIIGENGSGKSTALKIIAGILRPTRGTVKIQGRVAALLELGTGFHPDLTGHENIFLNASVLGFSRREVEERLDQIVDFADLQRFIDTPLKHYSSGMQVRLGFAIAIHCDPDVLITDEVLAVGDEAFQRKCIRRIDEMVRAGKTIILVSHSLDQVRDICAEAIWLDNGQVRAIGPAVDVADAYLDFAGAAEREQAGAATTTLEGARRWGSQEIVLTAVELLDESCQPTVFFETGEPMVVRMRYHARERVERPRFGIGVYLGEHLWLAGPNTTFDGLSVEVAEGPGVIDYRIPALPLLRGLYHLSAVAYDERGVQAYDHHDRVYSFHVRQRRIRDRFGMVWLNGRWEHRPGD